MIALPTGTQIWIAAGVTDLRRGFTGLSGQVQTVLKQNPFSGHVFVFRGRRGDLIKMLWWDGDGLCNPTTKNPQYLLCAKAALLSVASLVWPNCSDARRWRSARRNGVLLQTA
jgi:transposase